MAWDASRPVPYKRLVKEWAIYAAIMTVVFLIVLRESTSTIGLLVGLAVSLPMYIGLSYVLAKFGYQRRTLAEMRTPRAAPSGSTTTDSADAARSRARPAPTRRTSGAARRPSKKRR